MIPTYDLSTALTPLAFLRCIGLSPPNRKPSMGSWAANFLLGAAILFLSVDFWQSEFFLQVLTSGAAILYSSYRNLSGSGCLGYLLDSSRELDAQCGRLRYSFRWSSVINAIQIMSKVGAGYFKGLVMADVLLVLFVLKQEESHIMVHILRCQCSLLFKGSDLKGYKSASRSLGRLKRYLEGELRQTCLLCFLWCTNASFLGVRSLTKILLSQPDQIWSTSLRCFSYWLSCSATMGSLASLVNAYSEILRQKEEFEERLYWSLLSPKVQQCPITVNHMMIFEICSKEDREENLQIVNNLIYTVFSSSVTFLVILLQFGFEDMICIAKKHSNH